MVIAPLREENFSDGRDKRKGRAIMATNGSDPPEPSFEHHRSRRRSSHWRPGSKRSEPRDGGQPRSSRRHGEAQRQAELPPEVAHGAGADLEQRPGHHDREGNRRDGVTEPERLDQIGRFAARDSESTTIEPGCATTQVAT